MTEQQQPSSAPPAQPRGAGSGEKANASRSRNLVDWPPEPIPHEDKVDELLQQAEDNEKYNLEVNRMQTEAAKKLQEAAAELAQGNPENDDEARDNAKKAFAASIDPKKKEAALKGEMEARAKRDKAKADAAQGKK